MLWNAGTERSNEESEGKLGEKLKFEGNCRVVLKANTVEVS